MPTPPPITSWCDFLCVAIIGPVPRALSALTALVGATSALACARRTAFRTRVQKRGQVAQVVERSPEKAGVGGSTPSLATIILKNLAAESRNFQPTIQPMILTELAP